MSTVAKALAGLLVALGVTAAALGSLTDFSADVPDTRAPVVVPDAAERSARPGPPRTSTPTDRVEVVRPQPDDVGRDDDDAGRDDDDREGRDDRDDDDRDDDDREGRDTVLDGTGRSDADDD